MELGALGAGVFFHRDELVAQAPTGNGRRVDVHHHFTSPGWRAALSARNLLPDVRKNWTPARSIEQKQIVFGADFPYSTIADHVQGLRECGAFNAEELRAIERENALSLLPKYRTA